MTLPALVYVLCFATCTLCAGLLVRAWMFSRTRLLMFMAISFTLFAINNLFLFMDLVVLEERDLWVFRYVPALLGIAVMVVGFIWEAE